MVYILERSFFYILYIIFERERGKKRERERERERE